MPFHWIELQERSESRYPKWMRFAWARSDRNGVFAFAGVHAIPNPVRVHAEGSKGSGTSETFQLTRGGDRDGEFVTIQPAGVIEGRVVDAEGKPVAGIIVTYGNYDITTDEQVDGGTNVMTNRDGRYRFVGVAPGGHLVDVEGHQVKSNIFEVLPGKTVRRDLISGN